MFALTVNQQMQLQEQLLLLQVDRQRQDTLVIHQQQHPLQAEVERMVPYFHVNLLLPKNL
jgi:hypothetical protein